MPKKKRSVAKDLGAVFLVGIGKLSDGHRHDVRAPDYDDWSTPSELGHAGRTAIFWCGTDTGRCV